MGKPAEEWNFGDVEAQFKQVQGGATRRRFVHRVARASQHGAAQLHGLLAERQVLRARLACRASRSSLPALAQMLGIKPEDLVLIAEYCGGGFGSKGGAYPCMAIPAYMSKKIGKPVMMRISRAEEYLPRLGAQRLPGQPQAGLRRRRQVAGRRRLRRAGHRARTSASGITAALGDALALVYQPEAMRWRGVPVFTQCADCAPRSAARARTSWPASWSRCSTARRASSRSTASTIRKRNDPVNGSLGGWRRRQARAGHQRLHQGCARQGRANVRLGRTQEDAAARSNGRKVTGIGVGQAFHPAGFAGFDGLLCLMPDGKLHIHTGVGNLGTFSHSGTSRIAAEVLKIDWENCVIERGDSRKNLPWNIGQFGSNTSYTMTRTNYVAAQDVLAKLKEIAAQDLGGKPDDYDVDGAKVFAQGESVEVA